MDSKQLDQKSLYEPIREIGVIRNYFALAKKYQSHLHVWLKGKSVYFRTKVMDVEPQSGLFQIRIPKSMGETEFRTLMKERGNETFFSFKLDELIFFWKSPYRTMENPIVKFMIPAQIYKLQRRQNLRVKFVRSRPFRVHYETPEELLHFLQTSNAKDNPDLMKLYSAVYLPDTDTYRIEKEIIDLSAGGLAISLNADESRYYNQDHILHRITFRIDGRDLQLDGVVRYKSVYQDNETFIFGVKPTENTRPAGISENTGSFSTRDKLGVMFLNVNAVDDKAIAKFVYDENRKIFSLLI